MPRLIDADALTSRLKTIFCKECKETFGCICCSVGDYFEEIKDAPTINAAPEIHAHWINVSPYDRHYGRCSHCHGTPVWKTLYCPSCGAKMDEV